MSQANITLQNVAYSLIILIAVGWIATVGSSLILPFIFGIFLAIFLYPIDIRVHRVVKYKWISILISFITVLIPFGLIGMLFSIQFMDIIDSLPSIQENLQKGVNQAIKSLQEIFPFLKLRKENLLSESLNTVDGGTFNFLGKGLISSTTLLVNILLTFIYAYLILYYRKSIRNFIVYQFEKQFRPDIKETLTRIKDTVKSYVGGLGIVIIFLSVVNSLGLWIIGIQHPIFWGSLAGLLAIIPYVGTGLGGILPFIFSLATADYSWQPIAVLFYYGCIQFLEGNIITPKIVGDKVNINPLAAILSLVFFSAIWGIGGTILALPIISIIRIILSQFEPTQALAILMSSDVSAKAGKFAKIANE